MSVNRQMGITDAAFLRVALKEAYRDPPFDRDCTEYCGSNYFLVHYKKRLGVTTYEQLMDAVNYDGKGRANPDPWDNPIVVKRALKKRSLKKPVSKKRPLKKKLLKKRA